MLVCTIMRAHSAAQSCLATDAYLTADPGVASSIPAPYFRGD